MSMKTSNAPRTVYSRSGNLIVLFEGKRYAALAESSAIEADDQVTIEKFKSDGGRARVKVTRGDTSEVWRSFKA